ncbi:thiamine pyrophosphate-dependent enzyme [Yersinia aleksiciae]
MNNGTYAALHWFASALATDGIPSFDLPDINYTQIAEGYGVQAFSAVTPEELVGAINKAKSSGKPALIEVATWGPRQHA